MSSNYRIVKNDLGDFFVEKRVYEEDIEGYIWSQISGRLETLDAARALRDCLIKEETITVVE